MLNARYLYDVTLYIKRPLNIMYVKIWKKVDLILFLFYLLVLSTLSINQVFLDKRLLHVNWFGTVKII